MNDFQSLDFEKVKNIISTYSSIPDVKDAILNEEIDFNPLIINRKLSETKEFLNFLLSGNSISFDGIYSPLNIINKSLKGIILTGDEILSILTFHNHAKRIKKIINSSSNLNMIKEYSDSIFFDDNIANTIEKIIDNNGQIRSDASNDLKSINKSIDENFININNFCMKFIKENSEFLQETNVSERNNRYVFLFKNNYKNKFDGYTYGNSGSGQASYVEPSSLVLLNNKKNELEELKNNEIEKILKSLTELIASFGDRYINDFEILTNISVVYSKAYFGYENNGCIGELSDNLFLENIRHPLIDPEKVVANTYSLSKDKKGIVISGSNTGGKTVSLKVIGLAVCMTYLGIPVLSEKALIPHFDKILVDVDNNQSIKDSLSTFSAHLSSINTIINSATDKSLVLIDELISGTDPKEAEALSLSIIKKIINIGSKLIVTTHYDLIKKFAFDNDDILLSSVEFDETTLKPTYKYLENTIGQSNAFDIADRYLSDSSIVSDARKNLEKNKTDEEKLFKDLTNKLSEVESLKKDLTKRIFDYNSKTEMLDKEIQEFNHSIINQKNVIIDQFNEELSNIKRDIDKRINKSKNSKDLSEISKSIKSVDLIKIGENDLNFKVGDRVRVNDIGSPGYIISINGDSIIVDINGLTITTNISSLSLLPHVEKKKKFYDKEIHHSPSEIVLVGQRVEEALKTLDDFLDKARLANLKKVKIIHGVGTLTLKNAIWDYLLKINFVNRYYSSDFYDGGLAATIVELK